MNWSVMLADAGGSALLPPEASTNASSTDWLFLFIWYLSAFFFVLIIALMVLFAWKYRRQNPEQQATGKATHSTALELAWGLPPLVIVIFIFWVSLGGFMKISVPYSNAKRIDVRAWRWNWEFKYTLPEGGTYGDPQLHVPVDTPIELVLSSDDVIHSLFIPAFRIKKDVVPGKYNRIWFEADKVGKYSLYCTEYCGTQHSSMLSTVVVHEPGGFEKWLADASRAAFAELPDDLYAEWLRVDSEEAFNAFLEKIKGNPELEKLAEKLKSPIVEGDTLRKNKGCAQCHSVDGSPGTGPSWKGLWMSKVVYQDGGETTADENYLAESIMYPKKHVVSGYNNVMPEYPGDLSSVRTKREIDAIIQYIRSLKD